MPHLSAGLQTHWARDARKPQGHTFFLQLGVCLFRGHAKTAPPSPPPPTHPNKNGGSPSCVALKGTQSGVPPKKTDPIVDSLQPGVCPGSSTTQSKSIDSEGLGFKGCAWREHLQCLGHKMYRYFKVSMYQTFPPFGVWVPQDMDGRF